MNAFTNFYTIYSWNFDETFLNKNMTDENSEILKN